MFRKAGYLWSAGVLAGLAIATANPLWLIGSAAAVAAWFARTRQYG